LDKFNPDKEANGGKNNKQKKPPPPKVLDQVANTCMKVRAAPKITNNLPFQVHGAARGPFLWTTDGQTGVSVQEDEQAPDRYRGAN
jgi:hypothetical protein